MSNERLRAAIHQAGMEVEDLADVVAVDSKTVRRWIAGRTPRGRYRTAVAQALGTTEQELWPDHDLQISGRDEQAEILAAYARADDLATPDWRALLHHTRHRIDLLDLTLANILHSPGTPELLDEKASAGCQVRLLFSAPDSAHLVLADNEQGADLRLLDIPQSARDAERSLTIARSLTAAGTADTRMFIAAGVSTVLRFDDEMLVILRLHATASDQCPLLHLKRHSDHGLFERFAAHFDALWNHAQPVGPSPV